jgi:hypothetical protein
MSETIHITRSYKHPRQILFFEFQFVLEKIQEKHSGMQIAKTKLSTVARKSQTCRKAGTESYGS